MKKIIVIFLFVSIIYNNAFAQSAVPNILIQEKKLWIVGATISSIIAVIGTGLLIGGMTSSDELGQPLLISTGVGLLVGAGGIGLPFSIFHLNKVSQSIKEYQALPQSDIPITIQENQKDNKACKPTNPAVYKDIGYLSDDAGVNIEVDVNNDCPQYKVYSDNMIYHFNSKEIELIKQALYKYEEWKTIATEHNEKITKTIAVIPDNRVIFLKYGKSFIDYDAKIKFGIDSITIDESHYYFFTISTPYAVSSNNRYIHSFGYKYLTISDVHKTMSVFSEETRQKAIDEYKKEQERLSKYQ